MGETDNIFKRIKHFILFALNPINILEDETHHKWFIYLILPALGWMLFFLQVGLDKSLTFFGVVFISLLGFVFGYIVVGLVGFLLKLLLVSTKKLIRTDQIISVVALSHTYMTFSVILGLIYNLFGYSSSASFGITGLLCTLLPIYAAIRSLNKKRVFLAPLLATLVGVILLASWQLILIIAT